MVLQCFWQNMTDSKRLELKMVMRQNPFLFEDLKTVRVQKTQRWTVIPNTGTWNTVQNVCVCVLVCVGVHLCVFVSASLLQALVLHLVTRFFMALLIRLSATDRLHTQPDSGVYHIVKTGNTLGAVATYGEQCGWLAVHHHGQQLLHLMQICYVFFQVAPHCLPFLALPLSLPIHLPPFISNLRFSPSLCNHILYTIGSRSNLMHHYSLIKLICGDPLLEFARNPFMPPRQNTHTYTYSWGSSSFQHVLISSSAISQNAARFAKWDS